MKKWLGSVAFAALCANGALAADLPRRGPAVAPAPVYAAPIFTWSGFYVGLNAGVGFNRGDDRGLRAFTNSADAGINADVANINAGLAAVGRRDDNDAGFTGGVQIGWNWQFGAMVVGIEGDINYLDRDRGNRDFTVANVFGARYATTYDLDVNHGRGGSNWFGTIRPRIGVALDRTLLYVTGGLAYAGSRGGRESVSLVNVTANPDVEVARWEGRRHGSNWGWTLGAGVEHAFTNNWSLKLEYLYVDLDRGGRGELTAVVPPTGVRDQAIFFRGGRGDDNFHVVRAGLNYRFGGPAASALGPVVAAY